MKKIILFIFMLSSSISVAWSYESDETLSNINIQEIISPTPEHVKKMLKQLENWESYRPTSVIDLHRNPFQPKRYKFFREDD
tara:strand:- start:781 stop:1026 length:246 start_codon:yes stop_codon:yes gene_type:complete